MKIIIEFSLQFSRFSSLTEFSFLGFLLSSLLCFRPLKEHTNRETFVLAAGLLTRRRDRQLLPILLLLLRLLLLPHPPAMTVLRLAAAVAAAVAACTVGDTGTVAAAPRL